VEEITMAKENVDGDPPTDLRQGDHSTTPHGPYDKFLGQSPSALASAKDVAASDVDAASSIDLSGVKDEIAKLAQVVSNLVQKQGSMARDQVFGAVGVAGDNLSQSASVAQDTLVSIEEDVGTRIRNNPWGAVAVAALIGLLIGKMT
jgi:ElaB/YqjD/DUF883 family membrane-anchored ribosome-binding protein